MQARFDLYWLYLVAERLQYLTQLFYAFEICSLRESHVEGPANANDISTLQRSGLIYLLERSECFENVRYTRNLGPPVYSAHGDCNCDLVYHDRSVLDENRIREFGTDRQRNDPKAKSRKTLFVSAVLSDCSFNIDRLSRNEGKLTLLNCRANLADYRIQHWLYLSGGEILTKGLFWMAFYGGGAGSEMLTSNAPHDFLQFLSQHSSDQVLRIVYEKMIARQHSKHEGGGGLIIPGFNYLARHFLILQPSKGAYRAIKRRPGNILISLADLKISAQQRHNQLHDFPVRQNVTRSAFEFS